MSKEEIIEEIKLNAVDIIFNREAGWSDKLEKIIDLWVSKAIDQTREETIMECEGVLPEEMIFNEETDSEESKTWIAGFNNCRNQIKQSLINLRDN